MDECSFSPRSQVKKKFAGIKGRSTKEMFEMAMDRETPSKKVEWNFFPKTNVSRGKKKQKYMLTKNEANQWCYSKNTLD